MSKDGYVISQTNLQTVNQIDKIVEIFVASEGEIRPHFMLTGPSGAGKSFNISALADKYDLQFLEINAAQLTKEGISGNSLTKAMSPLLNSSGGLTICFVDEFDKLFISGNSNTQLAHESTNGVQNEFLKVLESSHVSVYGDYGKYVEVNVEKVLFVFAGAFNGEEDIDIDRLRDFGIKTEFIGRVGLIYNLKKISLAEMRKVLEESKLLHKYLALFPEVKKETVVKAVMTIVTDNYEKNNLGVRMLTTLLNKYFIEGGKLSKPDAKKVVFNKTLKIGL